MLDRIVIDNFATIEHLSFDLGPSLNVITGETGAGKSVLVQAISTALGDRADTSMVRNGSDKAVIQIAGEKNGEEVVISREIMSSGKSLCKLNGEMVTLNQIRDFCSDMVDIHGQYDNQQILNPENHILITDRFHNDQIAPALEKLQALLSEYHTARHEYDELIKAEKKATELKDYYQFESNYIEQLHLHSGEDEELAEQLELMKNGEKIYSSINTSYSLLHENENSILSDLDRIVNELSSVSSYSEQIAGLSNEVEQLYYSLEDVSSRLRDMNASLSFSESDMDEINERLSTIEDAKRKYSRSLDEIIKYKEQMQADLARMENFDQEKARLAKIKDAAYEKLEATASHVSDIRKVIAQHLESQMISELKALDFANSDFQINFGRANEIGQLGYDTVEFLISTNPGEPLMPLTKIASGGEISRIMLAFKHIIGDSDMVETMIFDEIDTGISGRTALTVGNKLKEIADHHQIVCITHLPQIAANGQDNYLITKSVENGSSHTNIERLDADGKVRMVATLFSGSTDDNAISAAKELISKCTN